MQITIEKACEVHLPACAEVLEDSQLGRTYFSDSYPIKRVLNESFGEDEMYVALDENKDCVGFFWFAPEGAFHSFPYLHMIAVKKDYRNKGIGTALLKYFEQLCFEDNEKVFLVVADFNISAKKLYESIGYRQVGAIPGLYKKGITEQLMMKTKDTD